MLLNDLIVNFGALMYRDQAMGDYIELVPYFTLDNNYFFLTETG